MQIVRSQTRLETDMAAGGREIHPARNIYVKVPLRCFRIHHPSTHHRISNQGISRLNHTAAV